jgi:hypothetical protein
MENEDSSLDIKDNSTYQIEKFKTITSKVNKSVSSIAEGVQLKGKTEERESIVELYNYLIGLKDNNPIKGVNDLKTLTGKLELIKNLFNDDSVDNVDLDYVQWLLRNITHTGINEMERYWDQQKKQ